VEDLKRGTAGLELRVNMTTATSARNKVGCGLSGEMVRVAVWSA